MINKQVVITNRLGLHARAAARFVKLPSDYESDVELVKDNTVINGKSIMGVMMLAAEQGAEVKIEAEGKDAVEAVEAVGRLLESNFEDLL